jgi:hypothetical protein
MGKVPPYYERYARAHGRTPEEMKKYDIFRYPMGKNEGFFSWNTTMRARFFRKYPKLDGENRLKPDTTVFYIAWLDEQLEKR